MNNARNGLVVRLKIKDDTGRVVDEIDAVSFKGLLSKAHEEELKSTETTLLQAPTEENGNTAIVRAVVTTRRGSFTGIGDASPANVNRRIAPHVIRMAETRALARALRVAVNIGEVSVEELGGDHAVESTDRDAPANDQRRDAPRGDDRRNEREREPARDRDATPDTDRGAPARRPSPQRFNGRDTSPTNVSPGDRRAMSDEQKKLLFRLAYSLGFEKDGARDKVLHALGVERLEWAERTMASKAIDALRAELAENDGRPMAAAANDGGRRG